MSLAALDLRNLHYAVLVAQYGSFRRAAAVLDISQSTISRRVQALERRLGIQLFERTRTGVRSTAIGERFMREAAIGAEHLGRAIADLVQAQRGGKGELRIGLMASLARGFLSDLLTTYHAEFPGVQVMIEETTSQAAAAGVLKGTLDAAFVPGCPSVRGCCSEYLWDERIYVAVPSNHPLSTAPVIAWGDIRNEIFLVAAAPTRTEIEDYLVKQLSGPSFHPRIDIHHVGRENLLHLVATGFGLTIATDSTLGVSYAGVVFVPLGQDAQVVSSSILWSETNPNPALKGLVRMSRLIAKKER